MAREAGGDLGEDVEKGEEEGSKGMIARAECIHIRSSEVRMDSYY